MPKILQILPALETGGVEQGVVDVSAAIQANGWESVVLSAGGKMVRELERHGAQHILLKQISSKNPLTIWRNVKRVKQIIKTHAIDVVHARSRAPAWSAYYATQALGVPFVTTFHGAYGHKSWLKRLYNRVMVRGSHVIAVSKFIKAHITDVYSKYLQKTSPQLHVTHRGVDEAIYDPSKVTASRTINLMKQWNILESVPVIMLPGRLTAWKGHEVLIKALDKVKRSHPDIEFQCVFVGSDAKHQDYRQRLEKMIRKSALKGLVSFAGDCRDMSAAYKVADIVISASTKPEAFGRVIAEGMSMERLVIASNHGGGKELIKHKKTGFTFAPGNSDALADILLEVLALDDVARKMVTTAARDYATQHFTKAKMCQKVLGVYKKALKS